MSDWNYLNKHRVKDGFLASKDSDKFNGAFCLVLNGTQVKVIASDGMGWQHVSVSLNKNPTFTPSWSIMCQVKELFWEPTDWVVQYHPATAEYVNNHSGCLHLWKCMTQAFPTPPAEMVGLKGVDPAMASIIADKMKAQRFFQHET